MFDKYLKEDNMITIIIKKELMDHFLSIRFFLILLMVIGLMAISGVLFTIKHAKLQADYQQSFFENRRGLASQSEKLMNLLDFHQTLTMSPNPLRFMVDGNESELPNSVQLSVMDLRRVENIGTRNPFLSELGDIDITFIVQFILSFVALTLTFNAVCGEKETGTLQLSLSNAIPRDKLLLGKYFSSIIVITIPFFIGLIIDLIIINLSPTITLSISHWLKIMIISIVSVMYISIFILLGIAVSAKTRSSTVSLVLLLLLWVTSVIIIPHHMAGILNKKLTSIPTMAEVEREAERTSRAVWQNAPPESHMNYNVGDPRNVRHVRVFMDAHNATENIWEDYRQKKISSVETVRKFTQLSPAAVYQYVAEAITGTGLIHVKHLLEWAKVYKKNLEQFFQSQDAKDQGSQHLYYHWNFVSHKSFNPEDVPEFIEPPMRLSQGLRIAILDILILVLFNIIFFLLAFIAFLRYDVR